MRSILARDTAWAAYAIADLQPGFAEQCGWFVHANALVMLYHGLTPPILFAMGPGAAVAGALAEAATASRLPEAAYMSIRPEHEDAVGRWYDLSPAWDDRRPMVRMVLDGVAQPFVAAASAGVLEDAPRLVSTAAEAAATNALPMRLATADASRLEALYAQGGDFAPDAFDVAQIGNGLFYGIEDEAGTLLAAGGTHVVDWDAGVAAIGNFCTLPAQRGKGFAGALLDAIVRDLRAGGVKTIVLNVDQRNATAQRLYTRHGFVKHCEFVEGTAKLRIDD